MKRLERLNCRLHVLWDKFKLGFFSRLAKWGLFIEHKRHCTIDLDTGIPISAPDIRGERYVFMVSYLIKKVEHIHEHWFETKKGKRIHTRYNDHIVESKIEYRAELESFFAHFSVRNRMWVHRKYPTAIFPKMDKPDLSPVSGLITKMAEHETHHCDFSKCRYSFIFTLSHVELTHPIEEVIEKSYRVLQSGLRERVVEINQILTGAENDGAMTSREGTPLSDNILCRHCGYPVFASKHSRYKFVCIHHGEINYEDIYRVDPKRYEDVLSRCMKELEHYCECPQD